MVEPKKAGFLDRLSGEDIRHIQTLAITVRSQQQMFLEHIDLIRNDNTLKVSDDRCERAKDLINAASKILLAYDSGFSNIKLTTAQQRRVLEMLQELADGKREGIQFQLSKEGTRIKEMFSKEYL